MAEHILSKDYVILLLNQIFRSGRNIVRVKEPFYGLELFTIDDKMAISKIVSRQKYMDAWQKVSQSLGPLRREAPKWFDFKDCFLSAGAVRPREWDEFVEQILHLRTRMQGPSRARKPTYLGIDTNVAYVRLFSRHFPYIGDEEIDPDCLELVISELVRKEIDRRIGYRYKTEDVGRLAGAAKEGHLLKGLARANEFSTRKAKLAQNELDYLTKGLGALEVSGPKLSKDKERVDRDIAESYADFQDTHSADVILITLDQNMIDHAKNARLSTAAMRFPVDESFTDFSNPWSVHCLLHDLAVIFGVVQLYPLEVYIWGEWNGKQTEDYELERVRIFIGDSVPFADEFAAQAERCGKIFETMADE
jgi:hypothetical protein